MTSDDLRGSGELTRERGGGTRSGVEFQFAFAAKGLARHDTYSGVARVENSSQIPSQWASTRETESFRAEASPR